MHRTASTCIGTHRPAAAPNLTTSTRQKTGKEGYATTVSRYDIGRMITGNVSRDHKPNEALGQLIAQCVSDCVSSIYRLLPALVLIT